MSGGHARIDPTDARPSDKRASARPSDKRTSARPSDERASAHTSDKRTSVRAPDPRASCDAAAADHASAASDPVGGVRGMRTVKVVSPGALATAMEPWWPSTMALTIARPSPVPPV